MADPLRRPTAPTVTAPTLVPVAAAPPDAGPRPVAPAPDATARDDQASPWSDASARFTSDGPLQAAWVAATASLERCIVAYPGRDPILHEGAIYDGAWVESTASICAEVLARFYPRVATETIRRIVSRPSPDGQLPYKVARNGPSYAHVQMVTPFARSIARVAALAADPDLLADAYPALVGHDAWLATHRDTRGTGGVEAFCTLDTGQEHSPRFWHIPDHCPGAVASRYDADNPRLPFVAPDLTANVAAQRLALAGIAAALREDPTPWREAAIRSQRALFEQTWHAHDGTFYDRDALGEPVRVSTDVLLRVLACGIGDDAFFDAAATKHLLNSRRFFAQYPFTAVAMDDPRFDPHASANTWGGATTMLSVLRAPDAFEAHGRYVELGWALWPALSALGRDPRFAQTLDPWVGAAGFSADHAPAALALLDLVERCCGVLPRYDGTIWVTGSRPGAVEASVPADSSYQRTVRGRRLEVTLARDRATLSIDGMVRCTFPAGLRLILDADARLVELVGMVARTVAGKVTWDGVAADVAVGGNERWAWDGGRPRRTVVRGVLVPS